MKKIAVISSVLLLLALLTLSAFADGELEVTESTLFIFDEDDDGAFFAKVTNIGDAAVNFRQGLLTVSDPDGNEFYTKKYISSSPSGMKLEPGEYVYVHTTVYDKQFLETKADSYTFTLETDNFGKKYNLIPSETEFYYSDASAYDNDVFITFTNQTDKLMHDIYFTAALYDADDTLVSVVSNSYSNLALHPGSTITVLLSLSSNVSKHLIAYDMPPVRVEGFVYNLD